MLSAVLAVVGAEPWYAGLGYGYGVNVAHPTGTSFARVDRLDGLGYGLYGYGRRKRDAEADADAYYGYGGYGYGLGVGGHYGGGSSYVGRTIWGLGRKKREANPHYGYGGGIALHPTGTSYRGRTVFGYPRGKRSAEPYYGYGFGYGGNGFAYNALSGRSFIARSGIGYYPGGVVSRG